MSEHLWEVDHSYYCSTGNYYSNECSAGYRTLADFLKAEGNSDLDMNLVFRWDWGEGGESVAGGSPFSGDEYYRNGVLQVFFIGQRKGLFRSAEVQVCRADEPAVRAYLEPRLAHLLSLWAPLSPRAAGTTEPEDSRKDGASLKPPGAAGGEG